MQTYESFFKLLGNEIQLTKREMEKNKQTYNEKAMEKNQDKEQTFD